MLESRKVLGFVLLVGSLAVTNVGAQGQSAQAAPPADSLAPQVGAMAPDFTLPWADSSGTRSSSVKLSELRGKVVVIAFYPADRTSGCTAEMTKYRDEYATLFGPDVVLLPISKDGLESHASWAKDMKLPFALVSDVGLATAEMYGSRRPGATSASRTTFVVGKDGRVTWRSLRFNALSEAAYTELGAEVAKARNAAPGTH